MADAPRTISVDQTKLSTRIFDDLVTPKFPAETRYELKDRYWSLAGDPAVHLEFTMVPDQATLDAIRWDMETIYQAGSMAGFELVADVLQLQFVDRLMLLKSLTYTDTPNLMDRLTGSMPSIRQGEGERKPDNNPLMNVGDKMMSMLPRRGY